MKHFLLFCLICIALPSLAQSPGKKTTFPDAWLGSYAGDLYIEFPGGIKDTIPVTFDLLATQIPHRWTYRVTYFSKKWGTMVKDYEIFQPDSLKSSNHYFLDEKDGVLIDMAWMNNRLYGTFGADGNVFATLLQKTDAGLYMEIRCTSPAKGQTTTSAPDEKGSSYTVHSYFTYTVQYANLKKKKKSK